MSLTYSAALQRLIERSDLTHAEMSALFGQLMRGELTPAQIAGFAVALRAKGETVDEVAAAAGVMRELVTPVNLPASHAGKLVDLCGTGGDGAHTFNISTAAMFVAAGAGVTVAKHGGRSVSSSSGSADVLEAAGININLKPEQVAQCIETGGIGFMFAPNHHGAMKHAAPVRRELGVRTVFNILGPLTNPAGAKRQLMGVFRKDLALLQAQVLQKLGSTHVMVVHGHGGMDEMTLSGPTHVAELKNGTVTEYEVTPESVGLKTQAHDNMKAASAAESLNLITHVLQNQPGPARDIVLLNAGAAIYVGGLADNLKAGVQKAASSIQTGAAFKAFSAFQTLTQQLGQA